MPQGSSLFSLSDMYNIDIKYMCRLHENDHLKNFAFTQWNKNKIRMKIVKTTSTHLPHNVSEVKEVMLPIQFHIGRWLKAIRASKRSNSIEINRKCEWFMAEKWDECGKSCMVRIPANLSDHSGELVTCANARYIQMAKGHVPALNGTQYNSQSLAKL